MNPLLTKAMWLHMRTSLPKNGETLAILLKDGGFQSVFIKGLQGTGTYKVLNWSTMKYEENITQSLVDSCHNVGINVVGFGFCTNADATLQGTASANLVNRFGLDGWIFDVEDAFDLQVSADVKARNMVLAYNKIVPETPVGWCSWPLFYNPDSPTRGYHPSKVAEAGLSLCDVGIPMCYWQGKEASVAVQHVIDSMKQWKEITILPIAPVGRAYTGEGWTSSPEAIKEFDKQARLSGAKGISWWFLDHAQPTKHPDWWTALKETKPFDGVSPIHFVTCPTCNGSGKVPA